MKNQLINLVRPFVYIFLRIFFRREYLVGRYFTQSYGGYVWALRAVWARNILRLDRTYPWPVHTSCYISNPANIEFDPDDLNNFQSRGVYFQCISAKIIIGKGSYIGPNVGLITSNHDTTDPSKHMTGKDIIIGEKCWIGMNSVLLPGVRLESGTIVAAGSVVTKSFKVGNVILAGAPARILKSISDN
jgi:hypothetical protein